MGEHRRGRFGSVIGVALLVVLGGAPVACRPGPAAPTSTPPPPPNNYNVILISVDTLRADRLNCYGYNQRKVSPHIDALAADGILFENHISASPWTTPAHLSMLTSLYPTAHGVTQSCADLKVGLLQKARFNKLPEARTTLAEVLHQHDFATGAFTGGTTLDPRIGFEQGFELYDTSMYKLNRSNTETMFAWIRRHSGRRFFLFWHTFEVHAPYLQADFLEQVLPQQTAARISDQLRHLSTTGPLHDWSALQPESINTRVLELLHQHQALTPEVCEALYLGGIRSADRWIGDFLSLLREQDLYEPSLIIFTSDHGEEFADHLKNKIYNRHGHTLYEELLKVPLIIKLPGQQHAGTRIESVVRMIDLMPTALDLLGIEAPPDHVQGTSLRPLWEQPGRQEDRLALSESLAIDREKKSLRTGRYKYIISMTARALVQHGRAHLPTQGTMTELYDLHQDPREKLNLLEPPHRDRFADLAKTLDRQLREIVASRTGRAESVELDRQTVENLKALGYIP